MSALTMPKVLILPHRELRAWSGDPDELGEVVGCPVVDLDVAMREHYESDAHFMPGFVRNAEGEIEDRCPRLKKNALEALRRMGAEVLFQTLVLDVDNQQAHASKGKVKTPAEWRDEQAELRDKLPWSPGMGWYDTRGGYRMIWVLAEPLKAEAYVGFLREFRANVEKHGIKADDFKDWNHIYRLPFVHRDGADDRLEHDFSWMDEPLRWRPSKPLPDHDPEKGTGLFSGIAGAKIGGGARYEDLPAIVRDGEGRHSTMLSCAAYWRNQGLEGDALLRALQFENRTRCTPPKPDDEIEKIARDYSRRDSRKANTPKPQEPAQELDGAVPAVEDTPEPGLGIKAQPDNPFLVPRFKRGSDAEVADHLAMEVEDDGHRCVYDRGDLWKYTDALGIWRIVDRIHLENTVLRFRNDYIQKGDKAIPFLLNRKTQINAVDIYRGTRHAPRYFDEAADGLTFANGFVRVSAGGVAIEPHAREQRSTFALPFVYEIGAEPRGFLAFLRQCFRDDDDREEKIELLRQFIGAALAGICTRFHRVLLLHGSGRNGKSVLLKIIRAMFPGALTTVLTPQKMMHEYNRATLAEARINIANEIPSSDILDTTDIKEIFAGDEIEARQIYGKPFFFRPKAGHIFAANQLPAVHDLSPGFWERWIVVEWNREFAAHEQDPGLADRLIREELAAITSWALDGAVALLRRTDGYAIPASSLEARQRWMESADQVSAFIANKCTRNGEWTWTEDLYRAYAQWAPLNGHKTPLTSIAFGRRLGALKVEKAKIDKLWHYHVALPGKSKPWLTVVPGGKKS